MQQMQRNIVLLIGFYIFWQWSQHFLSSDIVTKDKIVDRVHSLPIILEINEYLHNHPFVMKCNLILSSMLIDFNLVIILIMSLWRQKLKPIQILFVGLALRQLCQFINRLPMPESMVWFDPGWPSLFVTYDVANDFFFSGHTLISLIIGMEFVSYHNIPAIIYGVTVMMYEILFVIVIHGHYFMDIYAAISTYFMLCYLHNFIF